MFAPLLRPPNAGRPATQEGGDGKGGGEKAIKTGRGEGEERRGVTSEDRERMALKREETDNQTLLQRGSGNSRRWQWRRPTIFCIGYVAAAMATGCSRRRRRRRASLPMKDMRLARRCYHSLAAAAGCRRSTSLGPRSSAAGRTDGLGTKSRKENDQPSVLQKVPSLRPLDRPRPRRFRLRLLDRRRRRAWRRATRSTNRRSGSPAP